MRRKQKEGKKRKKKEEEKKIQINICQLNNNIDQVVNHQKDLEKEKERKRGCNPAHADTASYVYILACVYDGGYLRQGDRKLEPQFYEKKVRTMEFNQVGS